MKNCFKDRSQSRLEANTEVTKFSIYMEEYIKYINPKTIIISVFLLNTCSGVWETFLLRKKKHMFLLAAIEIVHK